MNDDSVEEEEEEEEEEEKRRRRREDGVGKDQFSSSSSRGKQRHEYEQQHEQQQHEQQQQHEREEREQREQQLAGDGESEALKTEEKIQVPVHFSCPITFELMRDPVFIASGHTYDRRSIAKWFQQGHKTCPSTGQRLRNTEITPNFALRNAILEWAKETKFLVDAKGRSC